MFFVTVSFFSCSHSGDGYDAGVSRGHFFQLFNPFGRSQQKPFRSIHEQCLPTVPIFKVAGHRDLDFLRRESAPRDRVLDVAQINQVPGSRSDGYDSLGCIGRDVLHFIDS